MNNEKSVINEANVGEKTISKLDKILSVIFSSCCLICSILICICFLFGITEINGVNISIFASIDLILSIFSLKFSMFYYYFTNIVCALSYIVVISFVLPNTIKVASNFIKSFSKEENQKKLALEKIKKLYKQTFFYVLVFMAICRCFNSFELSAYAVGVIACGILMVLSDKITELFKNKDLTVESYINNSAFYVITIIILLIIGKFLFVPAIKEALNGIKLLFSGVYKIGEQNGDLKFVIGNIVDTIVVPVFLCIELVVYLNLIRKILIQKENEIKGIKEIKSEWKKLFLFSVDVAAFMFIAETYLAVTSGIGNNSFEVLSYFLMLIKNDQGIIFMSALAGFVLCLFDLSYKKKPVETTEQEKNDNPVVVESSSENV